MYVSGRRLLVALAALVMVAGQAMAVGTGTLTRASGWYPAGTNLSVTANAGVNDQFNGWTGDTNTTEATISFVVDGPKSFTATFADIMRTITASAGANGSISPNGVVNVAQGDNQSFTIAASANYHINDVLVNGSSVGAVGSYEFTNVMSNQTIAASFAINTYTVTFDLGTHGTLDSGSLSQVVSHGGSATAPTITVASGWTFSSWDKSFSNVTSNMTVTAQYTQNSYTLIYLAGANGSITGVQTQTVLHGNSGTTVTAVPDSGYNFVKWSDDVATAARTDSNVTGGFTVTAEFAQNMYNFTINSAHGSPTGAGPYAHGATVNYSLPESTIVEGVTTQYVANAWVGTGSLTSGTNTNGSFTITNTTTMTWQWSTNYWIEIDTQFE